MKKTILITGGTGFIGSHAVVEFEKAGYKTVIIDNLSNSSIDVLGGIEKIIGYKPDFFQVDIRDKVGLENVFSKYNFDGVIHFAGLKSVGESCQKPDLYFDNNISGSITLFNIMKSFNVKNIVFSSSATVYGDPVEIPVKEITPLGETTNPYGKTKQLLEKILQDYSKFAGFNVVNLRYFNPIGAHPTGYIGENPNGIPSNLFPYILKVLKGELEYLNIFGGDYPTPDGTGVRDYIDIMDLIDGHFKAYKFIDLGKGEKDENRENGQGGIFENFNLGVGKGVSVLEMIKITEKVSGKKVPFKIVDRRAGDLGEIYANVEKANKLLGWKAKNSIEDSVRNGLRFYGIV